MTCKSALIPIRLAVFGMVAAISLPAALSAAVINRGVEGEPMSEIRPAPKSIFPDQKMITAQPSPSEVDPAYLGPVLLMKSAIVDLEAGIATLPLRKGRLESGETVWSIMTDSTDQNLANLHGVVYSPKLAYAVNGKATRQARIEKDGTLVFKSGKVDFAPVHAVTRVKRPTSSRPKPPNPDRSETPITRLSSNTRTPKALSSTCQWWHLTCPPTNSTKCAKAPSIIRRSRIKSSKYVRVTER